MSDQQTDKLVQLVGIGQLALELWRAENAAKMAEDAYHSRVRKYEEIHHPGERIRINPRDPAQADLLQFTRERYEAAQAAKRAVYAVKQRLRRACQKAARTAAAEQKVGAQ